MTEADWEWCPDPAAMLTFLNRPPADPAVRRFAVAACRRAAAATAHPAVAAAVALAEAMADGPVPDAARVAAARAAEAVWREFKRPDAERAVAMAAARAVGEDDGYAGAVADWARLAAAHRAVGELPARTKRAAKDAVRAAAGAAELAALADLLRDVIGNPFRPARLPRRWLTPTVRGLAAAIHDERAFDRLPILADALEEAGCDDPVILAHCRGPGPHVRGCWAVDRVLGRAN